MSSRIRQKEKKAEAREVATAPARAPLSVGVALGFLAAFVALRAGDLQLTWGRPALFWGALVTILVTVIFAVGLVRGDRRAYLLARPAGALLALALIAAPFLRYPANQFRLWSMAAALAGMAIALSLPAARDYYRKTTK